MPTKKKGEHSVASGEASTLRPLQVVTGLHKKVMQINVTRNPRMSLGLHALPESQWIPVPNVLPLRQCHGCH
jgi:hypothetical protein